MTGEEPEVRRKRRSTTFWVLMFLAVVGLLWTFRTLVLPMLLAAFLAYLINPIIVRFEERGIRRAIAVGLVTLAGLLFVVAGGWSVVRLARGEFLASAKRLPEIEARIEESINRSLAQIHGDYPALTQALPRQLTPGWIQRLLEAQRRHLTEIGAQAGQVLLGALLVPVFAFFLLRDFGHVVDYAIEQSPPEDIETTVAIWGMLDRIVGRYLRGLALESFIIGSLAALGLWILGVPMPLLLGLFTALINPIPYVGAFTSFSVSLLVAIGSNQGTHAMVGVLVLFLVLRLLDDLIVVPFVFGGSVHLHPAFVILAVIGGEQLFGLLGMVLAILTATIVKEVGRLLLEHRRKLLRGRYVADLQFVPGHEILV